MSRPGTEVQPEFVEPEEKTLRQKPLSISLFSVRTVMTGQCARRATASEMLPSIALLTPRWPRLPMTIRSASRSLANPTISSAMLIPLSIGVAVLRSHLFDIDVLINRTLVYGSLTATLLALYFGGIVVLQRLFVVLTGERSTLAVVASTLVIAALFNPLRRRIQTFIDRRFYRRKYDARKTLEAFSEKLRDEVDLEALSDDLVGMVAETMQPTHASLWLRPATDAKGKKAD
jgi:hypothetical protein